MRPVAVYASHVSFTSHIGASGLQYARHKPSEQYAPATQFE